jgi:hypothetical protein
MKSSRSSKSSKTPPVTVAQLKALHDKILAFQSKQLTPDECKAAASLLEESNLLLNRIPINNKYKMDYVGAIVLKCGEIKLLLRDYKGAEAYFTEQINHGSTFTTASYRGRARARENLGDFQGALSDLEHNRYNGFYTNTYDYLSDLAEFKERRGELHAAFNYYEQAAIEGRRLSNQTSGGYRQKSGSVCLALNDFNKAIECFQYAIQNGCYNIESAQQGLQRAQAGLQNQIETNNGRSLFNKGKEHFAVRRWSEARVAFDGALKKDSRNSEFFYWRGLTNKALQDYSAAVLDLKSALALGEKLAQPHLTEIKKIQTDLEHQQRVEEDQKRRVMEEKAREKQRELENQRRLAEEREQAKRSKRLEDDKRQLEKTRTEQKQQEQQMAVDECLRELQKMQISLKQSQPNLSTIDRDFTNLEKKIETLQSKIDAEFKEQFHTMRGNFYYALSKKETNQTRRQAMLAKVLKDFNKIMEINLFAEGIAEKIDEIKNMQTTGNSSSNFSSINQPKLSAEDQQKLEKKKEELRAKLNASTTAAASSSSSTSSGLFKSTAPPPCNPSQTVFNPRKNLF